MTSWLSVVVPCFNEERRLPRCLAELERYVAPDGALVEIIVVDDGSTDGTVAVARASAATYPAISVVVLGQNEGKGAAVRRGMLEARGERVAFTDADLSVPLVALDDLLRELGDHDMAFASRELGGARVVAGQGFVREFFSRTFDLLRRVLVVRGVKDTQCGMKAFRADSARLIFEELQTGSQLFDIEIVVLAARHGLSIAEVPVEWTHDPDSRIRYGLARSIGTFLELVRLKQRYRILRPLQARVTQRSRQLTVPAAAPRERT